MYLIVGPHGYSRVVHKLDLTCLLSCSSNIISIFRFIDNSFEKLYFEDNAVVWKPIDEELIFRGKSNE